MTDLERELRATLIEAARRAPDIDDLAGRAARPVRRRRTGFAAGLAATSMIAAGVVIAVASSQEGTVVPAPNGPASAPALKAAEALIGTWTPVDVPRFGDETPGSLTRPAGRVTDLAFRADGSFRGSDGCNDIRGTYTALDDGSFSAERGAMTTAGCNNVMHDTVLRAAVRFEVKDRSLTFYAADGRRLGSYRRA